MAHHQQDNQSFGSFKMELNNGSTPSLGSAEEDSMTGSDNSGSNNSLLDYQGSSHPALNGSVILGEYNLQTGSFMDTKSSSFRRMNEKRMDIRGGYGGQHGNVIYENLNGFNSFTSDSFLEGNPQLLIRAISSVSNSHASRRPRSEKKPIPAEKKDGKYFERRKRNNHAAKKSRDYRKQREDEVAMRANQLEKDNAILKAQLHTLREEATSLQQMLMQRQLQRQQQQQQATANFNRFSSFAHGGGGHISV
ncbi:hypothetical protein BV898_00198 [Hypsibius exemplaris]|uniref:BZIP domain-containing protein n=1 Tax=Hypsibius exemplaris TaxID=2072580 RepID=A0A1W0XF08_HYPEX|nr:hypothetical protein BV898_00198 [Hypsibius exemplaris]